jgi:hypothetical protein
MASGQAIERHRLVSAIVDDQPIAHRDDAPRMPRDVGVMGD